MCFISATSPLFVFLDCNQNNKSYMHTPHDPYFPLLIRITIANPMRILHICAANLQRAPIFCFLDSTQNNKSYMHTPYDPYFSSLILHPLFSPNPTTVHQGRAPLFFYLDSTQNSKSYMHTPYDPYFSLLIRITTANPMCILQRLGRWQVIVAKTYALRGQLIAFWSLASVGNCYKTTESRHVIHGAKPKKTTGNTKEITFSDCLSRLPSSLILLLTCKYYCPLINICVL